MPFDDTTPKLEAVKAIDISDEETLILALEAAAGVQEGRDAIATAKAESPEAFAAPDPDAPEPPQDNDQQQAMAKVLKKYIKALIAAGAITGTASSVF